MVKRFLGHYTSDGAREVAAVKRSNELGGDHE
jgi:hypothetical protein